MCVHCGLVEDVGSNLFSGCENSKFNFSMSTNVRYFLI
jgi:hypothetical protein